MCANNKQLPPPSYTSFLPFLKRDRSSDPYGGSRSVGSGGGGGIQSWFGDQLHKFKNRNNRTAAGAYEGAPPSSNAAARRGFGALDPDEAWDARVGNEADTRYGPGGYYEEQELGLHDRGPYGRDSVVYEGARDAGGGLRAAAADDGGYEMNLAATPRTQAGMADEAEKRGRPGAPAARNPFDDDAAEPSNISLRGVSPRPIETAGNGGHGAKEPASPAGSRRSIFTENV